MSGLIFGRLRVVRRATNGARGRSRWECVCKCGNIAVVSADHLQQQTRSCGCLAIERITRLNRTHGASGSNEHHIWNSMLARCRNTRNRAYKDYGGRGITVCEQWVVSFECFLRDMGSRPTPAHSLDRKNNDEGYNPTNCRWATRVEQNNNARRNHVIEFRGRRQTLAQWARELGIKQTTLRMRLTNYHWSLEEALTTPARV